MTTPIKRMAIVIRDDGYDRLYTPLTFAYLAAKQGTEVDILFVLWAVRVLTEDGAKAVRMHRHSAEEEAWFRDTVRRNGVPHEIHGFIKLLKRTDKVRLYGCRTAARIFGVDEARMLPEADGIVDAMWFLNEKAAQADHCQYL